MKVKIHPLDGHKYYGTHITIDDGNFAHTFVLWCNADFIPSCRELESSGMSLEEWAEEVA